MKKTALLLSLLLFSAVILSACGKNENDEIKDNLEGNSTQNNGEEKIDNNEEIMQDTTFSELTELNDCQKAIKEYLDNSNKQGEGQEIKSGDNIVVDYIGRLEDGTVFDTSVESVAKACEKYSDGRDYSQGLPFQAGAGQMIEGFDEGVIGMKIGQTKTVKFGPKKGYGEYNNDNVITYSTNELGDLGQFIEGETIYLGMYPAKILKVTDEEVTFDFNHELAGKNLIFDITVKSIN